MILNAIKEKLLSLSRIHKRSIMMLIDAVLLILVLLISFYIRLGYFYLPSVNLLILILIAPIIALPIFYSFGLYKSVIRYIGLKALISIVQATTLFASIWGLLSYMTSIEGIPRSVILINLMLSIIVIGGSRLIARSFFESTSNSSQEQVNIAIYGSGDSGMQLSNALKISESYKHVAYIEHNHSKVGSYVNDVPIFLSKDMQILIDKYNVSEIFIAKQFGSQKQLKKIIDELSYFPVKVKTLPSVDDLAEGKVKMRDIPEIDIEDLLGRAPKKSDPNLLKAKITDKSVLITGAGGSIGSELCRQILNLGPKKIILFEISEIALYSIEQELNSMNSNNIKIVPAIGSVMDKKRLEAICNFYKVQTIYHSAAYKHVPLVEYNQSQGVLNNSIGTLQAAEAAISCNVETFVLISTDKAVRPTNTMGAAKRVSELTLQALAKQNHKTCFTMVRFGNVLDSSGSVIPLFKSQIKTGGPLTLTHRDVVRYFMTIPEAVELVIQAGAMSSGGDVFVLDMGDPIKIYDLAVKMIQLSGKELLDINNPDGDIEILITGLRPGEKLYEELLIDADISKTDNQLIMRAKEEAMDWEKLKPFLIELKEASLQENQIKIRELLKKIVRDYKPTSPIVDLLLKD